MTLRRMVSLRSIPALGLLVLAALIPSLATAGECVSGSSAAALQSSGPFAGMWKYTLTVTWDTGSQDLSHLTFDLGLDDCPCVCDEGVIRFDTPAGDSDGHLPSGEPCTVDYAGDFVCAGDPSIPEQDGPAVKWDPAEGDCEPGRTGTGTFCFYSLNGPGAAGPGELWIKFGQNTCTGPLTGDLPACNGCPTPIEPATWGAVKSLFE